MAVVVNYGPPFYTFFLNLDSKNNLDVNGKPIPGLLSFENQRSCQKTSLQRPTLLYNDKH